MFAGKQIAIFKEAWHQFFVNNCTLLAASISYYLLFSLFPLALVAVSVAGFVLKSPNAQAHVIAGIGNMIPVSSNFIGDTIEGVVDNRGAIGIIAFIFLLVGGMSVFYALSKGLNAAWGIRTPRLFLRERLVDFCMMVGAGLLLLISMSITIGFRTAYKLDLAVFGLVFSENILLWHGILFFINALLTFVVFLLLYRFVPNTKIRWRDIWVGALAASISFEVIKYIFIIFIGDTGYYNAVYGPIGTLIALLMWAYISAVIFLFFARLTSAYAGYG